MAIVHLAGDPRHQHIPSLRDRAEAGGLRCQAMSFVDGKARRDRTTRDGPLLIDDAPRVAGEVVMIALPANGSRVVPVIDRCADVRARLGARAQPR